MGFLMLTQMHRAHLRKRKPALGAGRTFIGNGMTVKVCIRTNNYIAKYERSFCQGKSMKDDGIMSDFAAGAGQQEGRSDHYPNAGVRKSEELSEDIKKEQR